jgi:hypothetical protein
MIGYTFGMIASHPEGYDLARIEVDESHVLSIGPTLIPGGVGIALNLNMN